MTFKFSAAAVASLMLVACNQGPAKIDPSAVKQQIQQQEVRWNQAYSKRDGAAIASMYADDAAIANPGEPLVRGKDSIREATAAFAADPNLKVAFSANRIEVADSGELAYSRGQYTLTMTDPATSKPETSTGHYLTVWKKQADGSWKALEDFITPGAAPVSESARPIL
jgi:uncharacterized protein (TIGR02246 family)